MLRGLLQDPLAVDHGGNHDLLLQHAIDDAIAVYDQLADALIVEFRNLPASMRKPRQGLGSRSS
jgi:hypothetical protein